MKFFFVLQAFSTFFCFINDFSTLLTLFFSLFAGFFFFLGKTLKKTTKSLIPYITLSYL